MRLAIHFHEAADVASHADVLRRGVEMGGEITGVGRVAENAVALLVRRMLDGVSGHCVAGKAELIARRGKSDVGGAFHVGDRVAGGAAHGDSGVDVLPCDLVVVALETFGGINVGGEKDGMLVEVGARRRSEKQQDDSNQECGGKNEAMASVRESHGSPFAESEDFVCRFLHSSTSSLLSVQRTAALWGAGYPS